MIQRVAPRNYPCRRAPDDHTRCRSLHSNARGGERIGDNSERLPPLDALPQLDQVVNEAASRRPHPSAPIANAGRFVRRRRRRFDHFEVVHQSKQAVEAFFDIPSVPSQRFAPFIHEGDLAELPRGRAKRAISHPGVEDHARTECERQLATLGIAKVNANLRQVPPSARTGVKVYADLAGLNHLVEKQPSHPRAERATLRAGEAAVQVASVGQIAGAVHHAEHIDDGDDDQRPRQLARVHGIEQFAGDSDPADLVSVRRGIDPQATARPPSMKHDRLQGELRTKCIARHGKLKALSVTG